MLFVRDYYIEQIKKLLPRQNALILVGARQVGKTSLLQTLKQENLITKEVFISGEDFYLKEYQPKDFLEFLKLKYNLDEKKYLIIDEAQAIKNIGVIIKYLVDKRKQGIIKFKTIISGSGSLKIFRGITDSLIGRYNLIKIRPFSFKEFMEFQNFSIKNLKLQNINTLILEEINKYFQIYIKYGGYPAVVKAKTDIDKKKTFLSIYEDYIYKDIGFLLKEDENIYFQNFLKLFSSKIGSLIKAEEIIRELGIKKKLYKKFIQILESSFLFGFVSPFSKKVGNEIKKSKKGYMIDVGFVNYILGINEYIGDFQGKIIENFVYNELSFYKESFEDILFWQNRNGTEVDFLLIDNFDKKIIPVEVKSGTRDNIPKSLLSFISKYETNISTSIITTRNFYKKRTENRKDFIFIPYMFIGQTKKY